MKRIICFAVVALGFASEWTSANAQSVADVARQERARRQNLRSKIVVTNSSMKPAEPAAPAGDLSAQPADATETPKGDGAKPATSSSRDEKWWRQQFETARQDLKRAEDQITVLQLELNRANRDLLQRSDIYNRENVIGAEIAQINTKIEAAQKNAEAARQKITQLEDEMRRAGVPPGWGR